MGLHHDLDTKACGMEFGTTRCRSNTNICQMVNPVLGIGRHVLLVTLADRGDVEEVADIFGTFFPSLMASCEGVTQF